MPRSYTRAELRTRLEQLTDTENDAHLSTTEKNGIIDSAIAETWDQIIKNNLADKYTKKVSFSTVADQSEYALNTNTYVTDNDFYKLVNIYVVENTNQLRALRRIQPSELLPFKPPQSVTSMRLYYLPFAAKYTGDSQEFDGINGWEEHTLMTAACAVKLKKEDDYSVFYRRKKELEQRMAESGSVDFGEPSRVSRKRMRARDPFSYYNNNVNAYVLRGDKLELYYLSGYDV